MADLVAAFPSLGSPSVTIALPSLEKSQESFIVYGSVHLISHSHLWLQVNKPQTPPLESGDDTSFMRVY